MFGYKYTDKEIKSILKSMVVLVDTREQKNSHILEGLKTLKVQHQDYAMSFGDYSFYIPKNEEYGIVRDMYYDRQCVIERKNSLTELSGNIAQKRKEFENEFLRGVGCQTVLMVEGGSYEDILDQNYRTMLKPGSFFSSLITFENRYNIKTVFISKNYAYKYIYSHFYYYLREKLKTF